MCVYMKKQSDTILSITNTWIIHGISYSKYMHWASNQFGIFAWYWCGKSVKTNVIRKKGEDFFFHFFLSLAIRRVYGWMLILYFNYIDENIHKHNANANNIITIWLLVMAFGNIVLSHKNRYLCLFSNESCCLCICVYFFFFLHVIAQQVKSWHYFFFFFYSSLTARNTLIQPWMKRRKKVDFQFQVSEFFFLFLSSFFISLCNFFCFFCTIQFKCMHA